MNDVGQDDTVTVYPIHKAGEIEPFEWRWHRKAANGEIISQGEAHTRQADAARAARRANPDLPLGGFIVERPK